MKIALFSDCYVPIKNGVVTSMQQLKEGLSAKGHEVVVVAIEVPGYEDPEPDHVLRVPSRPLGLGTEQQVGLPKQKPVDAFLRDHEVEIIHSHTEFTLGRSARKAAKHLGLPLVQTTHTMWVDYRHYLPAGFLMTRRITRMFLRQLMKGAYAFISPSVKARNYYSRLFPDTPFAVIPNGVDRSSFRPAPADPEETRALRDRYGIGEKDRVIIFTGRIGKEKRVSALFEAVAPLLRDRPDVRMVFVGEGPARADLERLAGEWGVTEKTVFTGFIDWKQMYRYYSMADIYATASLSEVHPMTLIEAAMTGLPAVTRRDESYMTLIEDGVNGYLVDTDEEIGRKIAFLIDNPEVLSEFSRRSIETSQIFSAENHVKSVETFYRRVLDSWPGPLQAGA